MARSRPAAPSEQTPLLDARAPGSHGTSNAYRATQQPVVGDGQIQETQLSHPPHADGGNGQQPGAKLAQGASVRQIAPDLLRGALMVFMALDHVSVSTSAYPHGTNGADGEKTTTEVVVWSSNLAYALRTLTHLCAPGFGMLLGMGVAFFMASRAKQGWSLKELTMHYAKRMVAIIVVNEVAFLPVIIPTGIWLFNAVLWALAIDYFIVGMLAMALSHVVEPALVRLWPTSKQSARASRIEVDGEEAAVNSGAQQTSEEHARRAAFYIANLSLLVLSFVSLWWNIWLEDSKGDCDLHRHQQMHPLAFPDIPESSHCSVDARLIYEFFFHRVTCVKIGVFSGFPPMAWLSFCIFGLLYGRLLLASQAKKATATSPASRERPSAAVWSSVTLEASLAVVFAFLFVATRLFSFGNLSTHCLRNAPKALTQLLESQPYTEDAASNPYFASAKAFFYIVKYPPSPAYAFFTLAGCFALLVAFALATAPSLAPASLVTALRSESNPLLAFGRQPLFFYMMHMLLIRLLAAVVSSIPALNHDLPRKEWGKSPNEEPQRGIGLGVTYFALWVAVLVVMYPICRSYGTFKSRQPSNSVWRFL